MFKELKELFNKNKKSNFNISSSSVNKNDLISTERLFNENPYVRRSISIIASAIGSIQFKLYKKNKYLKDHFIYDLLNHPNGNECWPSFMEALVTNYYIFGNAFVFLDQNKNSLELHNLKPFRVEVVPGARGIPKSFIYSVNGRKNEYINTNHSFPRIGHIKYFSLYNDWLGDSPLKPIITASCITEKVDRLNVAIMDNAGRPSGIVTFKNGAGPLTKEQREETTKIFNSYIGPNNAGKVILIEGSDCEWKAMGQSTREMEYMNAKILAAREITETLGVPSILIGGIGLDGESTRANFKEVIQRFNEGTVLPLAEKFFNFFNNWLVKNIDPDCSMHMDLEHFLPLHDKRYQLWDKINSANFLSDKEKRILLGLENIEAETEAARTVSF